jgi:putative flippase GtrA
MTQFNALQIGKLLRYGGVGVIGTILYSGLTGLFVEVLYLPPIIASVGAFLFALPVVYWGHREISFRANAQGNHQVPRFVITMSAAFFVSSLSVFVVVNELNSHYGFALLVTMILVPLVNFVVLDKWVFREAKEIEKNPELMSESAEK